MKQSELISAYEFAERKGVSHTIVYRRIGAGEIETKKVGKTIYINWDRYKNITFPKSTGRR